MNTTMKPSSEPRAEPLLASTHAAPYKARRGRWLALAALTALAACASPDPGSSPRVDQTTDRVDQTVLGTAQSFAVLGGTTVTNTGATTVHGDLGVNPGLAITGFPPGLVTGGAIHSGDAVSLQAQNDTTIAYDVLAGEAPTADLTGQDLGGMTLTPGVYHFSSSAFLTGELTLDAVGDPDAVFVFQIGTTLTTASNASVLVIGAPDCNVFWQVGSSATIGTTTAFKGNIIALTNIALATGADVSGRALARNAAVTMDGNDVSTLNCTALGTGGGGGNVGTGGNGGTGGGGGNVGTGAAGGNVGTGARAGRSAPRVPASTRRAPRCERARQGEEPGPRRRRRGCCSDERAESTVEAALRPWAFGRCACGPHAAVVARARSGVGATRVGLRARASRRTSDSAIATLAVRSSAASIGPRCPAATCAAACAATCAAASGTTG
jgi:hypothetical protein